MIDLKRETAKLLLESSQNLAQYVASSSFEFWQRKDFRLYVDFDNLSQTEQDRIFNELEVSLLGLFILHLEQVLMAVKKEQKIVLNVLLKDLAPAFLQVLANAGVEEKFVNQWDYLINMRLKEYREDLSVALKESSSWKEFKKEKEFHPTWSRIETITIDCLSHIRRGKVEKDDPLWKLLRKWFLTEDARLNPITQA